MKKIVFLFAAVIVSLTVQAQRISETAPANLEGENVYLILKDVKIAQRVKALCDKEFAGGKLEVLTVNEYYDQVRTGDGYILAPVKEVVGDKMNCWLTLYKASPKAVVKRPATNGVFTKDPALKEVASYLVDQSKLNSLYASLYVRGLESVIAKYHGLSATQQSELLTRAAGLNETEILVLSDQEMESTFNQPGKISNIHPLARIENKKAILEIIGKDDPAYSISEMISLHTEEGVKGFVRVYRGTGHLQFLNEVEFEDQPLMNRAIIESFLTEEVIEKAAGK